MRNKACKSYIKKIKIFFPAISRNERIFIKMLSNNIKEYCEENNVDNMEDLYNTFGRPEDVFSTYLQNIDTEAFARKINVIRIVKKFLVLLLCILFLLSAIWIVILIFECTAWKDYLILYEPAIFQR